METPTQPGGYSISRKVIQRVPKHHQTFVVQLENPIAGEADAGERLCGRVENLGSGASTHFRSADELLSFLRHAPGGTAGLPAERQPGSDSAAPDANENESS